MPQLPQFILLQLSVRLLSLFSPKWFSLSKTLNTVLFQLWSIFLLTTLEVNWFINIQSITKAHGLTGQDHGLLLVFGLDKLDFNSVLTGSLPPSFNTSKASMSQPWLSKEMKVSLCLLKLLLKKKTNKNSASTQPKRNQLSRIQCAESEIKLFYIILE